ncbi:MAG: deoxyhypusine synthase family protein, partial [Planctomycetota bacterium]
LGGGGPKNFIQQTGPTINQILGVKEFQGASLGLQISTANVREGSLSSCTFGEAVTWGKYGSTDESKLVQIWGEYSHIFPLLAAYVLNLCEPRSLRQMYARMTEFRRALLDAADDASGGKTAERRAPFREEPVTLVESPSEDTGRAG